MSIHYQGHGVTLHHGDCLDVLRTLPDASVDSVVTDPPYGLEFMGKEWDGADGFRRSLNPNDAGRDNAFGRSSRTSPEYRAGTLFQEWAEAWSRECLRVLKPGGHLLAFGGTRTWHRLACAVEDAGFEVRDSIAWLYGSGFPKSLDVSKAIDKAAGAEREGSRSFAVEGGMGGGRAGWTTQRCDSCDRTRGSQAGNCQCPDAAPATDAARQWQGWGTALKPAFEPVVVARKPLIGTVAATVLAHGTGALNIGACRISASDQSPERPTSQGAAGSSRADSTDCTCPEPADARTVHTPSTSLLASSDGSPEGRNAPPPSAPAGGSSCPRLQGSPGGCPSSLCSCGGHAQSAGANGRASSLPLADAPEPAAPRGVGTRNPMSQSKPCPKCTAPNVERRRDTLVRPAIRRDDNTVLGKGLGAGTQVEPSGRWPANVVLDESQAEALDEQSGTLTSGANPTRRGTDKFREAYGDFKGQAECDPARGADAGGASRFFYIAREDNEPCPSASNASTAEPPSSRPSETAGSAPSDAAISGFHDTARPMDSPSTSATPSGSKPTAESATPTTPSTGGESSHDSQPAEPSQMVSRARYAAILSQTGTTTTTTSPSTSDGSAAPATSDTTSQWKALGDTDSAPFKYVAKADASERPRVNGTAHPTVKPLALMRWLVRLVTPPGGTVLEPFAGSGTTVEACIVEGFDCIAIEREADYLPLIRQRIDRRRDPVEALRGQAADLGLFDLLGGVGA